MKTDQQRIEESIRNNPDRPDWMIAKSVRVKTSAADVAVIRAQMTGGIEQTGGVPLVNLRVLSRRPAESAAKHIKQLPENQGYRPHDLAQLWGMSEETIRRHARDLKALRYVEVTEDEWEAMIMNPRTASKYA